MRRHDINRVVVLTNPVSTRHDAIRSRIDDVKHHFGNQAYELETFPNPVDTTNMLKMTLRERDIIIPAGGDGTARTAVEALADRAVSAHHVILLPLPGGYRNDLARQLHGNRHLKHPIELIEQAEPVDILPLQTTFDDGDRCEQRLSALYVGLGAMAAAASYLSSDEFRARPGYHHPLIRELYGLSLLPWTLKHARPVTVVDDTGTTRQLADATLANAPVVAKYLRPPVELLERRACYMELSSLRLGKVASYLTRLMLHPLVPPPDHTILRAGQDITLTPQEQVFLHMDGDAAMIDAGTKVRIGLHTTTFRALYSRSHVPEEVTACQPSRGLVRQATPSFAMTSRNG